MSNLLDKFTPEELDAIADNLEYCFRRRAGLACRQLARRLRQEEEESRRDPVTDPMPGDRIECATSTAVWVGKAYPCNDGGLQWRASAIGHSATIIRRREVQQ